MKFGRLFTIAVLLLTLLLAWPTSVRAQNGNDSQKVEWTLTGPPPTLVLGTNAAERKTSLLATNTGSEEITNIRLVQATLRDEETNVVLSTEYLTLQPKQQSKPKSGTALDTPIEILPGQTAELVLEISEDFNQPGSYTGSVVLASDQLPPATVGTLTIYNSGFWRQFWGVVLIALGVLLSLYVSVYAKRRTNRLAALRGARAVWERLASAQPILVEAEQKSNGSVAQLERALDDLREKLSEGYLDDQGMLPPKWSALRRSAPREAEFKSHLTDMAQRAAVLDELILHGVRTVLKWWDPSNSTKYEDALDALDDQAFTDEDLATVRDEVWRIVEPLQQAFKQAFGVIPEKTSPRTTRQIDIELQNLGATVWVLWVVVTIATGWVVLILGEPGFGSGTDLAACFFWGLGVHAASQSLNDLTPASISTKFGVPVPEGA